MTTKAELEIKGNEDTAATLDSVSSWGRTAQKFGFLRLQSTKAGEAMTLKVDEADLQDIINTCKELKEKLA